MKNYLFFKLKKENNNHVTILRYSKLKESCVLTHYVTMLRSAMRYVKQSFIPYKIKYC